jgi:drug/metabolite transporter (DMT)-like permease
MLTQYIGHLAALGTALMFAFGSTLFTLSGREIGAALMNRTRLLIAVLFVLAMHSLLVGNPFMLDAGTNQWFWLGLSGFVGLALGDAALFQGFILVGPRISMLIMALAPVLSAILGWLFLGESLTALEIGGIVLTVAGIGIVVVERQGKPKEGEVSQNSRQYFIGVLFALGGALGQAAGLILAKMGMANEFPAISALLIRLTVALIAIWAFSAVRGEVVSSVRTLRAHPRVMAMLTIAAFLGPVLGVWFSLIAVKHAPVGIASTLMALTPIFLMPIAFFVFKDRITIQAIIGTIVAFAGTALLFI